MQFIDYENIKVNSQIVDKVALSVLTGLGYFILNRITGKNKMKDAKNNLIENYKKLEDSKLMNLYKKHVLEEEKNKEPTMETYKEIFRNLKENQKDETQKSEIDKEIMGLFTEMKQR